MQLADLGPWKIRSTGVKEVVPNISEKQSAWQEGKTESMKWETKLVRMPLTGASNLSYSSTLVTIYWASGIYGRTAGCLHMAFSSSLWTSQWCSY